jgi:hypothetical protein
MSKFFYLKKFQHFQREINSLYQKALVYQVYPHILEQIENLSENCKALIDETKILPKNKLRYILFEESFEDLKLDYYFIFKLLQETHYQ